MRDDYLWDGSGEPDPEIQKLESALSKFRHQRPAPEFPEIALAAKEPRTAWWQSLWPVTGLRFADAAVFAVIVAGFILFWPNSAPVAPTGWDVTQVAGRPRVAGTAISKGAENLGVGQVLETDAASKATISVAETGEIEVDPGTRLRLLKSGSSLKRIELERGTIHATIWAEPGKFVVDTPSAVAVDLGCVYSLHVDDSGDGLLRTTLGWVGFKLADRESFIPAGAACSTKKKTGPGIPYFEDASEQFRTALSTFDAPGGADADRSAALKVVLTQSRPRDSLTLWHLLTRVPDSDRGSVYDRLNQIVAAPAGVTREGILRLDRQMLDLWWNELGFGDVSLWRHWERSWK
jgi:hypothetical protein